MSMHQQRSTTESQKRINPDFLKPQILGKGEGATINLGMGGGLTVTHSKAPSFEADGSNEG